MSILVDGVLVAGPFELTIRDRAGTDVVLHGGLRNVRDVKGLSGMAARVSVRRRVGRSGSVPTTRHREDRPVTVELQILAPDNPQQAWDDYYVLSRAVNSAVDTDRLLRWTLGTYSLQSLVRAESIEPPAVIAGRILETQIGLRASDPRAYSQTLRATTIAANTTVRVENPGAVSTPPLIEAQGPLTTPEIRCLDEAGVSVAVLYLSTITAGTLIFDAAERTVRNTSGELQMGAMDLARSRWFDIAAPSQRVQLVTGDAADTGFIRSNTRDAYQ